MPDRQPPKRLMGTLLLGVGNPAVRRPHHPAQHQTPIRQVAATAPPIPPAHRGVTISRDHVTNVWRE